jgi:hypothetical protein
MPKRRRNQAPAPVAGTKSHLFDFSALNHDQRCALVSGKSHLWPRDASFAAAAAIPTSAMSTPAEADISTFAHHVVSDVARRAGAGLPILDTTNVSPAPRSGLTGHPRASTGPGKAVRVLGGVQVRGRGGQVYTVPVLPSTLLKQPLKRTSDEAPVVAGKTAEPAIVATASPPPAPEQPGSTHSPVSAATVSAVEARMQASQYKRLLSLVFPGATADELIETVGADIASDSATLERLLVTVARDQASQAQQRTKAAEAAADAHQAVGSVVSASANARVQALSSGASHSGAPNSTRDTRSAALAPLALAVSPDRRAPTPMLQARAAASRTLHSSASRPAAALEHPAQPARPQPKLRGQEAWPARPEIASSSPLREVGPANSRPSTSHSLTQIRGGAATQQTHQEAFSRLKRNQREYAAFVQDCIDQGVAASDAFDKRQTRWHIPSHWQAVQRARRRRFDTHRREQMSAAFFSGETDMPQAVAYREHEALHLLDSVRDIALEEHQLIAAQELEEHRRQEFNNPTQRVKQPPGRIAGHVAGFYRGGFNDGDSLVQMSSKSAQIRRQAAARFRVGGQSLADGSLVGERSFTQPRPAVTAAQERKAGFSPVPVHAAQTATTSRQPATLRQGPAAHTVQAREVQKPGAASARQLALNGNDSRLLSQWATLAETGEPAMHPHQQAQRLAETLPHPSRAVHPTLTHSPMAAQTSADPTRQSSGALIESTANYVVRASPPLLPSSPPSETTEDGVSLNDDNPFTPPPPPPPPPPRQGSVFPHPKALTTTAAKSAFPAPESAPASSVKSPAKQVKPHSAGKRPAAGGASTQSRSTAEREASNQTNTSALKPKPTSEAFAAAVLEQMLS